MLEIQSPQTELSFVTETCASPVASRKPCRCSDSAEGGGVRLADSKSVEQKQREPASSPAVLQSTHCRATMKRAGLLKENTFVFCVVCLWNRLACKMRSLLGLQASSFGSTRPQASWWSSAATHVLRGFPLPATWCPSKASRSTRGSAPSAWGRKWLEYLN